MGNVLVTGYFSSPPFPPRDPQVMLIVTKTIWHKRRQHFHGGEKGRSHAQLVPAIALVSQEYDNRVIGKG